MKKVHSILVAVSISLAMALTLPSCSGGGGGGDGGSGEKSLLLNFTSDYTDGELRWLDPDGTFPFTLDNGSLDFYQDSWVFAHEGKIFLLERPLDANVTPMRSDGRLNCLSPTTGQPVSYGSDTLSPASNPYDIAFIGNNGYIAQYGLNYIQVFSVSTCKKTTTIPLPITTNDTANGATINAASIKASGNTLLVVAQRWIKYPTDTDSTNRAADKGIVYFIDATNPTSTSRVQLKYKNPLSSVLTGGKLYVGSGWDLYSSIKQDSCGIEYVNVSSKSGDTLVSARRLGGGATDIVLGESGYLYTTVYINWGNVLVKQVSLSNGTPSAQVPSVNNATCLVYDNEKKNLFIGNGTPGDPNTPVPSLKFYNTTAGTADVNNSKTTDGALPPYSLAIVRYH